MKSYPFSKSICFILTFSVLLIVSNCKPEKDKIDTNRFEHDLNYDTLPKNWDEAIPLGNGMLGALVYQRGNSLRLSLDRADLWDLRPMENVNTPEWKFKWVYQQWDANTYHNVQDKFDAPYDKNAGPSKLPAAALEFNIEKLGEVENAHLFIKNGICEVKWKNGTRFHTLVHADQAAGWFSFDSLTDDLDITLFAPDYNLTGTPRENDPYTWGDLRKLGYPKGEIIRNDNSALYTQKGWGGFEYQVYVQWEKTDNGLNGFWSITSSYPERSVQPNAESIVRVQFNSRLSDQLKRHSSWWNDFWSRSSIVIPDKVIERQWYLEMYKLGSCTRKNAPPISLQSVWTADYNSLPPWKGDFHHDLNTQLSYWPTYSSNHIDLAEGFTNWLWQYRDTFKWYTRSYFETDGLNVPGVSTITGQPMGGWIQYAFGPTVSAWLAQNFYLQWVYSGDSVFLKEKAYPWFRDVATYLEQLSVRGKDGKRKLPISSSPEINDNSRDAWFSETTNFDLALIKFAFEKAGELATALNLTKEADHWKAVLAEWPDYSIDPAEGFLFAPGHHYNASHRHFSHLMAFHPLGLVDWSKGENDQALIRNTIATLDKYGPDWWTGYSYSWQANLKARAFDGEGAAKALFIFADGFCLPNSFHVNGDQSGKEYSKNTYRPFTLEGNFAFAAGLQEMLIQSHTGVIRVFPAIPDLWKNASFTNLRTYGAFIVSATMIDGKLTEVTIKSEKGGKARLYNSFPGKEYRIGNTDFKGAETIDITIVPGNEVIIKAITK